MKMHWKALAAFAVAGTSLSHATYSRVESMGKHDTYFMDDISVWTNPANMNIYPNYLMGDLGQMVSNGKPTTADYSALTRYNQDPTNPWFGAVFAKSLGDDKSPNRYPQIAIGGAFNRDDELLSYLDDGKHFVNASDSLPLKMDGMLGFTASNGMMFGFKVYGAGNEKADTSGDKGSWFTRYTLGVNVPLDKGIDLEVSGGLNNYDYTYTSGDSDLIGGLNTSLGFDVRGRAFISVPALSGELVPAVSFVSVNPLGREIKDFKAGMGVNVSLDRGFFWIGADYVYHNEVNSINTNHFDSTSNGARVSFGIERNVWTDWLVLRVGGQKYMTHSENKIDNVGTRKSWNTNTVNDGTEGDHVGFGIGLNIEDKLKVDATMGEDFVFTGGALLSGPVDHVFSRISATYSF
jgi:hypothetical protein